MRAISEDEWQSSLAQHRMYLVTEGRLGKVMFWSNGDLRGISMKSVDLSEAGFTGCDLRESRLERTILTGSHFFHCRFDEGAMDRVQGGGAEFVDCVMTGLQVSHCEMDLTIFERCNLIGSVWVDNGMRWCTWTHSNLRQNQFRRCQLDGTRWSYSNVYGVEGEDCTLQGADFRRTQVQAMHWDNATMMAIAPIGSRWDQLMALRHADGVYEIRTGCFHGSLEEFLSRVHRNHDGQLVEDHYTQAMALIQSVLG